MSKGPMSDRGRQRVLQAASQVNPKDNREAAILGGIVRTAIDRNSFDKVAVRAYVPGILRDFNVTSVSHQPPTEVEIAAILKRFVHFYNPTEEIAA